MQPRSIRDGVIAERALETGSQTVDTPTDAPRQGRLRT
jgi:hypothetical protein